MFCCIPVLLPPCSIHAALWFVGSAAHGGGRKTCDVHIDVTGKVFFFLLSLTEQFNCRVHSRSATFLFQGNRQSPGTVAPSDFPLFVSCCLWLCHPKLCLCPGYLPFLFVYGTGCMGVLVLSHWDRQLGTILSDAIYL